jgi:hypothetical protein
LPRINLRSRELTLFLRQFSKSGIISAAFSAQRGWPAPQENAEEHGVR